MKNYIISYYTKITSLKSSVKRIFNLNKSNEFFTYNKTGRHINTNGYVNLPANTNCIALGDGKSNDCLLFDVKEEKEHINQLLPKERRDYNKFTDKSFFVDYKLDGSLEITNQEKKVKIICNDNEISINKDSDFIKIGNDIEIKKDNNDIKISAIVVEIKQGTNSLKMTSTGVEIKTTLGLMRVLPTGQVKIGTEAVDLLKIIQQLITTTKGLGAVTQPEKNLFTPLEVQISQLIS
jgi:hypothetical protein